MTDEPSIDTDMAAVLRALGNEHRLTIMEWLVDPRAHFPKQRDGDLVDDGVCVGFITQKIGLSQPTVTVHMQALAAVGLVTSKKIKNWVFYKPDRKALDAAIHALGQSLGSQSAEDR
ncbi:ArsR/SmtB family transcription factor [Roseovarius aquimarinus]|uniref:ArsR/SmtB family transcription factor n=1 Tax=Roseovarius aquimarinus TaxID=1229156 RepID=A0ABW7I683_9RHOB